MSLAEDGRTFVPYCLEPCGMDILTSVGIGISFLLKCRFLVGIGFGLGIEKSHRFFSGFLGFFSV
jgi:hypothetical protein